MARTKKTETDIKMPTSREDRDQMVAEVTARYMRDELTAEEAQAEIDVLNGVRRVVDTAGTVSVVDANLTIEPPAE